MKSIRWEVVRDSILLLGILTFSLPLKTPALQLALESILNISFPIQLSTYTLFLPMWLGITVLIHLFRIPEVCRQLKFLLLLMTVLFIWMWLGAWFSEWRGHSLKHSGRYTIHFLVFLTLLLVVRPENVRSMTGTLLGWFLGISGLTVAEQLFTNWRLQPWFSYIGLRLDLHYPPETMRLSSLFENPNPYGIVSVSLLGIALYGISQRQWVLGFLGALAAIWGAVESESRNALMILLLASLLTVLLEIGRRVNRGRNYWKILIGVPSALIAILVIIMQYAPRAIQRTQEVFVQLEQASTLENLEMIDPRLSLYRMALEYGLEKPSIFGVGVKSFGYAVSENASGQWTEVFQTANESWNAHNALLTIWIEMGWVGLFLALGFLFIWCWKFRLASVWIWGSILALCLGQIFDYFVWQVTFMTIQSYVFALMAASAYCVSSQKL